MPMTHTRRTREELEEAFAHYQQAAREAGQSGNWDKWCDLFTLDCTYIEDQAGRIGGREGLKRLYRNIFTTFPAKHFIYSPVEWYMVDEFRGWTSCQFNVRMSDPGDGSIHEEYCFSLLKYVGNGLWSHEEDLYDPNRLMSMVDRWIEARKQVDPAWDPSQEAGGDPYYSTAD